VDLTNARAMPLTHWERAAGGLQGDGAAIRNQRVQKSRCAEIILCNARSQGHVIACVSPCKPRAHPKHDRVHACELKRERV